MTKDRLAALHAVSVTPKSRSIVAKVFLVVKLRIDKKQSLNCCYFFFGKSTLVRDDLGGNRKRAMKIRPHLGVTALN